MASKGGHEVICTVGIADMAVSGSEADILVTHSLGSCIGLSIYDPDIRVGGLVHCMMPVSKLDPVKAAANPLMYTDTGVACLLKSMFDRGANRKRLVVTVAGAASLLDERGFFKIDILISEEDVGGNIVRTMYLHMDTGQTEIRRKIVNGNPVPNDAAHRTRFKEEA